MEIWIKQLYRYIVGRKEPVNRLILWPFINNDEKYHIFYGYRGQRYSLQGDIMQHVHWKKVQNARLGKRSL